MVSIATANTVISMSGTKSDESTDDSSNFLSESNDKNRSYRHKVFPPCVYKYVPSSSPSEMHGKHSTDKSKVFPRCESERVSLGSP